MLKKLVLLEKKVYFKMSNSCDNGNSAQQRGSLPTRQPGNKKETTVEGRNYATKGNKRRKGSSNSRPPPSTQRAQADHRTARQVTGHSILNTSPKANSSSQLRKMKFFIKMQPLVRSWGKLGGKDARGSCRSVRCLLVTVPDR